MIPCFRWFGWGARDDLQSGSLCRGEFIFDDTGTTFTASWGSDFHIRKGGLPKLSSTEAAGVSHAMRATVLCVSKVPESLEPPIQEVATIGPPERLFSRLKPKLSRR